MNAKCQLTVVDAVGGEAFGETSGEGFGEVTVAGWAAWSL
jgi:hypothetical protein